jgi:hypothetical protein
MRRCSLDSALPGWLVPCLLPGFCVLTAEGVLPPRCLACGVSGCEHMCAEAHCTGVAGSMHDIRSLGHYSRSRKRSCSASWRAFGQTPRCRPDYCWLERWPSRITQVSEGVNVLLQWLTCRKCNAGKSPLPPPRSAEPPVLVWTFTAVQFVVVIRLLQLVVVVVCL